MARSGAALLQRGSPFEVAPIAWDKGLAGHVVQTRKPLMLNRGAAARGHQLGGRVLGEPGHDAHDDQDSGSYLGAPVLAGKDVIGVIGVYAERVDAFSEADSRLLETLAGSMGVALENARLFDRTAHLLKETEQRNAELAVINSIQQGIAAELDFQAIVDVVGEKLREVFASDDIGIRWHDPQTDLIHQLYVVRRGERLRPEPVAPSPQGAWRQMQVVRQPVVANSQRQMVEMHLLDAADPEACRSLMGVPILSGERMLGLIGVESFERDDAFSAADVRLLATVAASMGLALENVRLFNETREALEQQTATARVLQVVSQSPTDVQPVFDAIVDSALALCGARMGGVARFDGELVHLAAFHGASPEGAAAMHAGFPMKPSRASILARTVLEGAPVHLYDVLADPDYALKDATVQIGYRSNLAVPLIRDGKVIGSIGVCREEPSYFPRRRPAAADLRRPGGDRDRERAPVQRDARASGGAATATIPGVISRSPGDVQPVFEAIATSAYQLLDSLLHRRAAGSAGLSAWSPCSRASRS